jgi:hypothetical protein
MATLPLLKFGFSFSARDQQERVKKILSRVTRFILKFWNQKGIFITNYLGE